jgi:hypothetical protein
MKRAAILTAAVVVLAGGALLSLSRLTPSSVEVGRVANDTTGAKAKADSVWYHESDVALLATTGRPQMVEFFHPN